MKWKLLPYASATVMLAAGAARAGPTAIDLGAASSFAVLSGSGVTNTGSTVLTGSLGVWPGTSITGFPPGIVENGAIHDDDAVAQAAEAGALTAYTTAAGETGAISLTGQNLGGLTLTPGIYNFSSSALLTGTLTLNDEGNPAALFIFQIGSTLTTASASIVKFINGGAGANVFWQVGSSATLGTGSQFDGTILANTSITLNTGANIGCGAALALNGAVTLQDNAVSSGAASCGGGTSVPEPYTFSLFPAALLGIALARRQAARSRGVTPDNP